MNSQKILIIGGPRSYKETIPLHLVNFPFNILDYKDSGILRFVSLAIALYKASHSGKYAFIFSDMLNFSGIIVCLFSRIFKIKLVLRIRGEKFSQERTTLKLLLKKRMLKPYFYRLVTFHLSAYIIRRAWALIPDSNFGRYGMIENTSISPESIIVSPIPVRFPDIRFSDEELQEIRALYEISSYKNVLLSVTGFDYSEKMAGLMDALPLLADYLNQRGDTVFLIAGGGIFFTEFEKYALSLNCRHIKLLGFINNIMPLYALCTVFAHFSYQDGCPNILLESMLAQKPVIVNNFLSLAERVDHGADGFVIDLQERKSLTHHLNQLLEDEKLRNKMGSFGKEKVLKHHNERVIGMRLAEILTLLRNKI